jgi:hypothetical protein
MREGRGAIVGVLFLEYCLALCPGVSALDQFWRTDADDALADLTRLSVLAGRVLPTSCSPYSPGALLQAFEDLRDHAAAEGPASEAQEHADLLRLEGAPILMIDTQAQYEFYNCPRGVPYPFQELLATLSPWRTLALSYQFDLGTSLHIRAEGYREYQSSVMADNFPAMFPGNTFATENNYVREGYLRTAAGPFEMIFGRQALTIGPSPFSSLLVSHSVPFLDAATLKGHLGPLSMTLVVSTLENRQAADDISIPADCECTFSSAIILDSIHYFEWDFGPVRIGIGGQSISCRENNAFQLGDLFPVFSWHQANVAPHNLSLIADAAWVPVPGLELYAQGGFDDINANTLRALDAAIPSIDAYLLGVICYGSVGGLPFRIAVEGGYTHYLWGSFEDYNPLARGIYRLSADGSSRWLPLSSPFGPGTDWLVARCSASFPWGLRAELELRWLRSNPLASLVSTPYEDNPAVAAAVPEDRLRLAGDLQLTLGGLLRLRARPAFHWEPGGAWFDLALGCALTLGTRIPLGDGGEQEDRSP